MRLAFIILLWLTTINLTTAANRRPHIRRSGKGSSGGQSHQPLGSLYPQHSLVHPFLDGIEIPNWEYGGATLVTDDYIRLTPDRQVCRSKPSPLTLSPSTTVKARHAVE